MMFRLHSWIVPAFLSAIALNGGLSACNSNAQTTPSQATPVISQSHPMDHGGMMDHGMALGPADAEYDLRFIDAMIPHHEGAVTMAQDILKKSQRPELQQLAKDIIKAQQTEIAQMKQWRQTWYPQAPTTPMAWHSGMNHMMEMSTDQIKMMRMDRDLGNADAEYDRRFLDAMIPHHEGALVMAQDLLQKSQRPELQQLGKNIIKSQQAEIDQMQQWRKTWYGQ